MLLKLCLAACIAIGASAEPVNCKEVGTQYAVKGCSSEYYQCHNGKLSTMQCPSNLFFDINNLNCDYRDRVENCVLGNAELQYGSDDLPSCGTQADGTLLPIELKCTNKYVICDHGKAVQRQCPYDQFYSVSIQRCDHKRNVEGCQLLTVKKKNNKQIGNSKFQIPRQISGSYGAPVYQHNSQPSYVAPAALAAPAGAEPVVIPNNEPTPTPAADKPASVLSNTTESEKIKFDCSTREDGLYPDETEECSPFFWNCVHQQAFKYHCPKGLFFDELLKACGYRYDIPGCGGTRPATTEAPAPAKDVPKVNFDCKRKETGYYPMEECSAEFVQCLEGIATLIVCPAETVFDVRTTSCVHANTCGAPVQPPKPDLAHGSSSVYQAPAADVPAADVPITPSPVVAPTRPPVPTIKFDCSDKKDGFYPIEKCKKEYVVCSSGIASIMSCHGDLVFNQANGMCDYPDSCLHFKPEQPNADVPAPVEPTYQKPVVVAPVSKEAPISHDAPSEYSAPAASPPEVPNVTAAPVPAPVPVLAPVNCAELENGAHSAGKCSPNYILCWEQEGVAAVCPLSLVFNPKKNHCDHKINVEGCSEYVAPVTTIAPPIALNPVPVVPVKPNPLNFSCKGKADGIYSIGGCTHEFVQCYSEILSRSKCIASLYFNEDNGMCDYKENVVACGGKLPTPAPTSAAVQNPVAPNSPYNRVGPAASPVAPAYSCSNKADGLYSQGCSSIYFACSQGTTMQNLCPASLKFSQESQHCDFEQSVPECGGKLPVAVPEKKLLPPVAAAPPDNSACKGKSDGIFPTAACSANYLTCVSGNALVQPCAGNLIFNKKNGACDYKRNVKGCQSAQAPAQIETATAPAVPISRPTIKQPTFNCQGLSNGYYSTSVCVSSYAYCEGGRATIETLCPAQLVFDNKKQRCDYRENTAECLPKAVPTSAPLTAAPPAPVSQQPVIQSQTSRVDREQFCLHENDGIYSNGCSRKYFVCSEKVTYSFHCDGANVFDEIKAKCVPPSEVQACVSSVSQLAHQSPPQVQQAPPQVQQAAPQVQQQVLPLQPVQPQVLPQNQPAPQYNPYQQGPSQAQPQTASTYYASAQHQYQPVPQFQAPAQQYQQYQYPAAQQSYANYGYGY